MMKKLLMVSLLVSGIAQANSIGVRMSVNPNVSSLIQECMERVKEGAMTPEEAADHIAAIMKLQMALANS